MSLAEINFSDLLLLSDGQALLKGCPGYGEQLIQVPPACDLTSLRPELQESFISKARLRDDGSRDAPITIRFSYQGMDFRVADIRDVQGQQTWFLRRLAASVPGLKTLGMPENFQKWLLAPEQRQGLLLLSGAQASGKTTVASSLLTERLTKFGGHAVTFENPAELPLHGHWGEHGYCFQTEILGEHELAAHIERAHRYASPNIIFIGEIRTRFAALEALRVALGSSRQLVIATIHGLDIIAALDRLKNWAMEMDGPNAAQNLANSLLGVFHLDLRADGDKKTLHLAQSLLTPFNDSSIAIRAKIREGKALTSLAEDMRFQANKIKSTAFHEVIL